MNHRLYEEWLFAYQDSEDELTPQQTTALREHLQGCEACRLLANAWQDLELRLQDVPLLAPEPGFTNRWEKRLQVERQRVQRRQVVITLAFILSGVLALGGTLVFLVWPWLQTPDVLLWTGLYRLYTFYAYLVTASGFLSGLFRTATGSGLSLIWMMVLAGMLSELGVLWVVSFRLLTNPRRATK